MRILIVTLTVNVVALGASHINPTCSSPIQWTPCSGAEQFECGSFSVPLDYAHHEVGDASLAVARFKATKQPRLGTIFTNPGGPGGSGVGFLLESAGLLLNTITLGQYDIVSWDPRGVNQSTPQISCGFTSLDSLGRFFGNTIPSVGVEARGNFTDQDDLDAFFAKVNETDSKAVETGQRCLEANGDFLKYMGTTAVVRDMVSLSECLEGPGKPVNYWGFSYGTVIGNYFVNMFPERVGRVILDGVVDTVTWATEPTYKLAGSELAGAEAVFTGFAEECAQAGPQNCVLANNNSTPASIAQDVRQLIDAAYDLHKAGVLNVTSFELREEIWNELYVPTTWDAHLAAPLAALAVTFSNLSISNTSTGVEISSRSLPQFKSRQNTNMSDDVVDPTVRALLTDLVITCVDSIDQEDVTTQRLFEEVVRVTHDVTPMFGEVVVTTGGAFCHRFPVRAVERFTGPFNHKLANPIIVIGNKADPVTPMANAQKVAMMLGESARFLEQNGFGHTSTAENSDCTQGVARDYFLHGTLPRNGLVCETNQALFPPNRTLISPNPNARRGIQL